MSSRTKNRTTTRKPISERAPGWSPPGEAELAIALDVYTDPEGPEYDAEFTAEVESMGFDREKWLAGELGPGSLN